MPTYSHDAYGSHAIDEDDEITEPIRPARSVAPIHDDDVQHFLDDLAHALTAGDGEAVAALCEVPVFVVADEMVRAIDDAGALAAFFGGAKDEYSAKGVTDTRGEILSLERPTARIVQLTVRWPWLDESGRELGSESSSYVLRKDDDGNLKLRVAVMRGASAD